MRGTAKAAFKRITIIVITRLHRMYQRKTKEANRLASISDSSCGGGHSIPAIGLNHIINKALEKKNLLLDYRYRIGTETREEVIRVMRLLSKDPDKMITFMLE